VQLRAVHLSLTEFWLHLYLLSPLVYPRLRCFLCLKSCDIWWAPNNGRLGSRASPWKSFLKNPHPLPYGDLTDRWLVQVYPQKLIHCSHALTIFDTCFILLDQSYHVLTFWHLDIKLQHLRHAIGLGFGSVTLGRRQKSGGQLGRDLHGKCEGPNLFPQWNDSLENHCRAFLQYSLL